MKCVPSPTAPLADALEYYLELRGQLGFKLQREGAQLRSLAHYAQEAGHIGPLTIDLMVRWAQSSPKAGAHHKARRLEIARRFARFWKAFAPETEVPCAGMLGPSNSVRRAHIYTPSQISDLMNAAGQLSGPPAGRGLTYQTLFGLLASTGLRISEALQIQVQDLDVAQGLLRLRQTKGGQSRHIVLHASALQALQRYQEQRPSGGPGWALFSLRAGAPIHLDSLYVVFTQVRRRLGWPVPGWRLHDLRHTFAVNCLIGWYRQGVDLDQKILSLSTYLGHARPEHTYWYLTAVPELMALVQSRWTRSPLQPSLPTPHA